MQWTDACQSAFTELKAALVDPPVLYNPDFDKPFILQTDVSGLAIGAMLSQEDTGGCEHPISYYSRKVLPRETRYATIEKECLAVKLGIEKFSVYLTGRKFTVQTDHRALKWLNQMREQNSRLMRWSLALQPYQFQVVHRAGRQHANANALSRIDASQCFAQKKEGGVWPRGHLIEGQSLIEGQDNPTDEHVQQNPPSCNGSTCPHDKPWPPDNSLETTQPFK